MISELQLLKGLPIEIEDSIKVYPLTVDEVVTLGENKYYSYLHIFMLSKDDLNKKEIPPEIYVDFLKMDDYVFLLSLIYQNEQIRESTLTGLSLFLKEIVDFDLDYGLVIKRIGGDFIITKGIFNKIKEVVFKQNFINKGSDEEEFNPYDDKARALIEKRNKFKKLIEEQNAQDGLGISDIISIVASHSPNTNFHDIWSLTIYQLYTMYIRLGMKDQYETQIYLLPHTSQENKNELKHWMSKIKQNN